MRAPAERIIGDEPPRPFPSRFPWEHPTEQKPPRPFHLALLIVWCLPVIPGVLLAPPAEPGAGLIELWIAYAFQAFVLAATSAALLALLRQLRRHRAAEPRHRIEVVHALDSIEATWTTHLQQVQSLLFALFAAGLNAWMMLSVIWSIDAEAIPYGVNLWHGSIVAASALPWLRQLWLELRPTRRTRVRATVDQVRVESDGKTVELPMHGLQVHTQGEQLQLVSGDARWSGTCPDSAERQELETTLGDIARRVGPDTRPEAPAALKRLRGREAE